MAFFIQNMAQRQHLIHISLAACTKDHEYALISLSSFNSCILAFRWQPHALSSLEKTIVNKIQDKYLSHKRGCEIKLWIYFKMSVLNWSIM